MVDHGGRGRCWQHCGHGLWICRPLSFFFRFLGDLKKNQPRMKQEQGSSMIALLLLLLLCRFVARKAAEEPYVPIVGIVGRPLGLLGWFLGVWGNKVGNRDDGGGSEHTRHSNQPIVLIWWRFRWQEGRRRSSRGENRCGGGKK